MASLAVEDETEQNEEIDISLDENPHPLNDYLMVMTRLNNDRPRVLEEYLPFLRDADIEINVFLDRYGVPWNEWADGEIEMQGIKYIVIWNHDDDVEEVGVYY